jgi:hypothetical protein
MTDFPGAGVTYCFECTKDLDQDGDCFECGSGKFARDCTCVHNDYLCQHHQAGNPCNGFPPEPSEEEIARQTGGPC